MWRCTCTCTHMYMFQSQNKVLKEIVNFLTALMMQELKLIQNRMVSLIYMYEAELNYFTL